MTGNDPTTIEALADLAQVILGLAAVVSIWIGLASLREIRRERSERIRPRLAFDHGGQVVKCEDKKALGVLGLNPAFIQTLVGPQPREVRMPASEWGRLRNHGGGVALNADITFVAQEAQVGQEVFQIDREKLNAFPYMLSVNRIPASPTHIHPGEEGEFLRIPTPVYEREGNRERINGVVVIRCRDILEREHFRYQEFLAHVEHGQHYGVLLSFGDELGPQEARQLLGPLGTSTPGLEAPSLPHRAFLRLRKAL